MQFPKVPLFLGVLGAINLTNGFVAHAQNTPRSNAPQTLTTVDAYGNMVRSSANAPALAAAQPNLGTSNVASSDRYRRGDGHNDGRSNSYNNYRGGTNYYVPALPYYPYAYGGQTYNNYYYPAVPSTTVIIPPAFSWQHPATISSIPLGTYYGGYAAPAYPSYPSAGYGYPSYGYPSYPALPFQNYGTSTYIYGNAPGSIYSQSQSSGYGISLGRGSVSARFGNSRSSNSTTVTRR